ncbi:MAG: PAS domain S-box protein [Burkholderiaceae bacterium]|nr:PAS domain S-box protein [Burkholderiaceae bacterium]
MADSIGGELRDLYENAPCGYHSVGRDGTVIRMNRTELEWLGYASAELVGRRRYRECVAPPFRQGFDRVFETLQAGCERDGDDLETRLVRKDGTEFDALLHIGVVRDGDGAFLHTRASVVDITGRKRAEREAHSYAEQLRAISQRMVEIQENERRRLSAELHDRIGQDLATINLNLHIIKDRIPAHLASRIGSRLDDSIGLVEGTVGVVRDIAGALRPLVLDDYGLAVTLRSHAEQFSARTGIRVVVEANDPVRRLRQEVEMMLFRIGQEALTNVLKHSQADRVRLKLEVDSEKVCLTITDTGCGFDAKARREHATDGLGLLIMQERLRALNGALDIHSAPGAGTSVIATVRRA